MKNNNNGEIAVKVKQVSKIFKMYNNVVTGPILEFFLFWKKNSYHQKFVAVDNVDLTIKKGEVIGIVGSNGAGKTTLLKMIAGLLPVNKGNIIVNGKITALLALGIGFNSEFSGRENIYYNGLLLGMKKDEVLKKMSSIIEFAELGNFIDKPIRTYSSGMKARLLFATSMSIDPDILIVDEALATGDAYFVQKSSQKIKEFVKSGATILFVSHNLRQIEQLCDRAYLMDKGSIISEGNPTSIIREYNNLIFNKKKSSVLEEINPDLILEKGTGDIYLTDVRILNDKYKESNTIHSGDHFSLELKYRSNLSDETDVFIVMNIFDGHNHDYISQISTYSHIEKNGEKPKKTKIRLSNSGSIIFTFESCLLLNNRYYFRIVLIDAIKLDLVYFEYKNVAPFMVTRKDNAFLQRGTDAIFWHPFKIDVLN